LTKCNLIYDYPLMKNSGAAFVIGLGDGGKSMRQRYVRFLKFGLFAMAMLPLSGCSTAFLGGSSAFGGSPAQLADISGQGNYTAEGALAQARNYFRTSNFGYSAAFYKKTVELMPQNPEGYVGLAASYDRLGRFDLSDRVYASLFRISGETTQYYNNVGYSYMLRGNLTAALTSFRKAAALDPKNIVVANNLQLLTNAAAAAAPA